MFSVILNHILILLCNFFHSSNQSILRVVSELKPAWQAGVADKVRKLPGRGTQMTNWVGTQTLSQDERYSSKRSSSPQCLGTGCYLETGMLQMIRLGWVPWCELQSDNDTTYKILTKLGGIWASIQLIVYTWKPGTREAEAGRFVCLRPSWSEIWASLGYSLRPYPKREKKWGGGRVWFGQRHRQWKNSTWKWRQKELLAQIVA